MSPSYEPTRNDPSRVRAQPQHAQQSSFALQTPRILHGDVFLWRSWRVTTRRLGLGRRNAWLQPTWRGRYASEAEVWQSRVAVAACVQHGTHSPPVPHCGCGLYGYATVWDLLSREVVMLVATSATIPPVFGCFRAFGPGIRAEHGMRVRYGTPALLLVEPSHAHLAPALRARYGCAVEVTTLVDYLEGQSPDALGPVDLGPLTIPPAEAALGDLDWTTYVERVRDGQDR